MSLVAASLLGLGIGARHALEADHLAAVCNFVSRGGGVLGAAKTGALWGLGHSLVIVVAGGALVATGAHVPESLAMLLDMAVAVMLVGLGAATLFAYQRARKAAAAARAAQGAREGHDEDERHEGHAGHAGHAGDAAQEGHQPPGRRPLAVGLVHGASGTAAIPLLVATTIPGRSEALVFVVVFGIVSLLVMAAVAALVALPLRSMARRSPEQVRVLQALAGAASIAAGLVVAWSTLGPEA
ncbi:HoxN/HupN/NixA family nickel/cobalt transporter [Chondromyces apiculatus]|uniref:Nickel/cobalt efflux system n=1 Tax=Chondromyces apiculatus DSM 436 TaxID=1192034 RepID=A0A017T2I9_9BACT|nr:hypothetical protein [Chondromyces apiculatus]EYF03453.1 Nickel transporter UreH [Chondromyces apiculatus DSM 436]